MIVGAVYNGSGATMTVIAIVFFYYNHPNNCSPAGTVWSSYNLVASLADVPGSLSAA